MNKDKVMAIIRKRASESGVSVNTLLLTYFFERFLVRLSGSEYKTDLILKGGFLLSSIMGVETRTTMEMDMLLRNRRMDAESIRDAVENIISVTSDDEVIYEIRSIEEIKIEDKYPGYRVSVMGRLSNIRQLLLDLQIRARVTRGRFSCHLLCENATGEPSPCHRKGAVYVD